MRYRPLFLYLSALCFFTIQPAHSASTKSVIISLGYSGLTTSAGAKTAADSAKAGLKGEAAKLVIVVFKEGEVTNCPAALKEIATVFDSSIIYGTRTVSDANAILTVNGRTDKIVVIALGGNVQFTSASSSPTNVGNGTAQTACGKKIGDSLKVKIDQIPSSKGKFILLYGDCHVDMDDYLVKGLVSSLTDKKIPIVGNASIWVMEKGKIYETGKNMGLLVWGDFTIHCGMAFDHEGSNDADAIIQKAYTSLKRAGVDTMKTKPDFCLVNNCRGRFGTISAKPGYPQKEADTIRHTLGMSVPFISIYGSGEIGKMDDTSSAVGDGNSISVMTLTSYLTTAINDPKHQNVSHTFSAVQAEKTEIYSIDGRIVGRLLNSSPARKTTCGIAVQRTKNTSETDTKVILKGIK